MGEEETKELTAEIEETDQTWKQWFLGKVTPLDAYLMLISLGFIAFGGVCYFIPGANDDAWKWLVGIGSSAFAAVIGKKTLTDA